MGRFFGRSSQRPSSSSDVPVRAAVALTSPIVKVALLGDSQVGKTSLMVRFVEGAFDEHQQQTQGINFMEKAITMRGDADDSHEVTLSIWDIGGHRNSRSMLPLVCNDSAAILLVFDLTRHETLDGIREWHRQARGLNKCAMPVLVGTKYDMLLDAAPGTQYYALCAVLPKCVTAAVDNPYQPSSEQPSLLSLFEPICSFGPPPLVVPTTCHHVGSRRGAGTHRSYGRQICCCYGRTSHILFTIDTDQHHQHI